MEATWCRLSSFQITQQSRFLSRHRDILALAMDALCDSRKESCDSYHTKLAQENIVLVPWQDSKWPLLNILDLLSSVPVYQLAFKLMNNGFGSWSPGPEQSFRFGLEGWEINFLQSLLFAALWFLPFTLTRTLLYHLSSTFLQRIAR